MLNKPDLDELNKQIDDAIFRYSNAELREKLSTAPKLIPILLAGYSEAERVLLYKEIEKAIDYEE